MMMTWETYRALEAKKAGVGTAEVVPLTSTARPVLRKVTFAGARGMNARRRKTNLGMPSRVYERGASWYWVRPNDQKWIRLCRVDEGQRTMLARLARRNRRLRRTPVRATWRH
ncbi:hypothetical protein ACTMU2_29045 [Cupriavidus basilensis]